MTFKQIQRDSDLQLQVGPPVKNQAVTNTIVAAFSFTLNTNLNTTPRQLKKIRIGSQSWLKC